MFPTRPPDPQDRGIPIFRLPPQGTIQALAISEPFCVYTHFYRGRTYPCPQGTCPLCQADYAARFYSYTAVLIEGQLRLLELTAAATWHLAELAPNGLRGKTLIAERTGRRQNAPIHASLAAHQINGRPIPPPPDVRATLIRIWRIGKPHETANDEQYAAILNHTLAKLLENSR